MLKKVLFVINPISGIKRNPQKLIDTIHGLWRESGIEYDIAPTERRGHGTELSRQAAGEGYDMVVAVGGDGTINEVGRGLIGTSTALGIIPAGSGNGFARNLRIPLNQKRAIAALRSPRFKQIDVGRVNKHYFFNIAGAGIDADVTELFEQAPFRGPLPYFVAAIREYFRYDPRPISIQLNGAEFSRSPLLISFANLPEFGMSAIIAPNAKPDDGLLDLCVINPVSIPKALVSFPKLFNGKIETLSEVEIYQTPRAIIRREKEGPIHTDGDLHFEQAELTVEILPRQLKIALPEGNPHLETPSRENSPS